MDLGVPFQEAPAMNGILGHTPLAFLPALSASSGGSNDALRRHASKLQAAVNEMQFPADGSRCWRNKVYYMHNLPQVGFGSIIEYASMFLGRALSIGTQFRIGPNSSMAWTSEWFCGSRRSLSCYFDLSACCATVLESESPGARPLMLPRRRDPINVAARGFNDYGSVAVSAQMTKFLFDHMTPWTRAELQKRRSSVRPWRAGAALPAAFAAASTSLGRPLTIGMHIRGGDSCHLGRYCPSNLTATYFTQAARLRSLYGANRILLATDNPEAARLCASSVLGFDCTTQSMERAKFDATELIENRVAKHSSGSLSGSRVALDALADMDMLGDCDMFVLLLRSCFARVAYALAMGRQGRAPPVISLEAPWSPWKGGLSKPGKNPKGMKRRMKPGWRGGKAKGGGGGGRLRGPV